MAFLSKIGNMLRQTASKQISSEFCALKPSVYQAIRCLSSMSSSKLFIGGLSYATDEQSLKEAFAKYGEVVEARVIMDRETGRSRGFGFVTYTSSEEASSAIQALDGQDLHGRCVRVNYATDRARPSFGGGNYGGGYGSNAYGGGGGGYGGNAYGGGGGGGGYGNSAYGGSGGYGAGSSGYGSGGYGSGGNYQGGGGGGNYGSDSYGGGAAGGSGVGYSGGGNYAGGNTYEGVNSGGYGSTGGNYGVAGGDGGSDNYVSASTDNTNIGGGGFDGGIGQGSDGVNQFGSNESSSMGDVAGDFNQDDPLEENQRDDGDETGDFAKRA
ncbi:hypothetical protein I3843_11G052400 [Carya illinoinensis]|nr:hypothetical protein I3843_11G052400 [Carya illinoinensis]